MHTTHAAGKSAFLDAKVLLSCLLPEASTKESNRARFGTRLNIWQRWGELRASILGVARGVLTAIVRAFAYCLSRFVNGQDSCAVLFCGMPLVLHDSR